MTIRYGNNKTYLRLIIICHFTLYNQITSSYYNFISSYLLSIITSFTFTFYHFDISLLSLLGYELAYLCGLGLLQLVVG